MNPNAPHAMITRLKWPSGPPNAVFAKGKKHKENHQMLLTLKKNGVDSLFKEVWVFKAPTTRFRPDSDLKLP